MPMNTRKIVAIKSDLTKKLPAKEAPALYRQHIEWLLTELERVEGEKETLQSWKDEILSSPKDRLWIDHDGKWYRLGLEGEPAIVVSGPPEKFMRGLWQKLKSAVRGL